MRRIISLTVAAFVVPFVLFGCSGGEDAFTPTPTEVKRAEPISVTPQTPPPSEDLKRLEGTWAVASQVYNGTPQFLPRGGTQLIIRGSTYSRKAFGESFEMGAIRVDASKKPATLDFVPEVGREKGRTILCVFDLDGDVLRYCHRPSGGFRPAAINGDNGGNLEVVTLRRANAK